MESTASPRSPWTRRGTSAAPSPTFQLQVGGNSTASTPQYSSGTLSGQATPGSLVTIVDGDVVLGVVVADSSGNWQFTPTLSKGKHSIMAEATNSAGYTSLLPGPVVRRVEPSSTPLTTSLGP